MGFDFTAYVNQAGQFASGQTNYKLISSVQGGCEYLAGHLWHYLFVYKLYLSTRYAELLWKVISILIQTLMILSVTRLARSYFRNDQRKYQLVGFILATNHFVHKAHQQVNNDDFLALYAILAILMMSVDHPLLSVVFMNLSLSIKAGALLLVPTMFGWIHYFYGTFKLIQGVVVTVVIQMFIAAPFISETAAKLMGFLEAGTGWEEYKTFIIGRGRTHGAIFEHTVYWDE